MSFIAIFVMIFLIAFALIGGVVMFLSKTIDHGEAQFGPDGRVLDNSNRTPLDRERIAEDKRQREQRAKENRCVTCGVQLDSPDDPLSGNCGGDCWGCIGMLEAEMGGEQSLVMVKAEIEAGLRNPDFSPIPINVRKSSQETSQVEKT